MKCSFVVSKLNGVLRGSLLPDWFIYLLYYVCITECMWLCIHIYISIANLLMKYNQLICFSNYKL